MLVPVIFLSSQDIYFVIFLYRIFSNTFYCKAERSRLSRECSDHSRWTLFEYLQSFLHCKCFRMFWLNFAWEIVKKCVYLGAKGLTWKWNSLCSVSQVLYSLIRLNQPCVKNAKIRKNAQYKKRKKAKTLNEKFKLNA